MRRLIYGASCRACVYKAASNVKQFCDSIHRIELQYRRPGSKDLRGHVKAVKEALKALARRYATPVVK